MTVFKGGVNRQGNNGQDLDFVGKVAIPAASTGKYQFSLLMGRHLEKRGLNTKFYKSIPILHHITDKIPF